MGWRKLSRMPERIGRGIDRTHEVVDHS
jgi:hypothetical protein